MLFSWLAVVPARGWEFSCLSHWPSHGSGGHYIRTKAGIWVTASKIPGGPIPNRLIRTKAFHLMQLVKAFQHNREVMNQFKSLSASVRMSTVKTTQCEYLPCINSMN